MLLLIFLSIFAPLHASIWDNLTANIAVVEYQPIIDDVLSVDGKVLQNTIEYMKLVTTLSKDTKLDLVVFPEDTLRTTRETGVEVGLDTNCDDTTKCGEPLDSLAYTARLYQTYIVVNLVEKAKCGDKNDTENCQVYGYNFYNTDVVFDRNGTITNKYRKYNLFGELEMDQPDKPDQVVIQTDFGVNFGIFTCFDILFKSPAQDLLSQDIQGIIFPSMWFSELPFLTALQTQNMFSHAHDIMFLSSGANNPLRGSGGTAIYRGKNGAFSETIKAEGGNEALLYQSHDGNVTSPATSDDVDALAKEMDNFYLLRDSSVDNYNSTVLDTTKSYTSTNVCYLDEATGNQLCCNFVLRTSSSTQEENSDYYTYHLVAFSGVRSFSGVYNGGIEVCAIIACPNSSLSSCGHRFSNYTNVQWPVTFQEITIVADFEKNDNKTQFPNSLLSSIRPIDARKTTWTSKETEQDGKSMIEWTFSITEQQDRLLTFGIYGRNFGQDSPPETDDSEGTSSGNLIYGISYMMLLGFSTLLLNLNWK